MRARGLFASLVLVLLGCGDAQVDQSFRGTGVFSISGSVTFAGQGTPGYTDLRLALFFRTTLAENNLDNWLELTDSTTAVALPMPFVMNIFAPPDSAHLCHSAQGDALGYGVGQLLVYDDLNGDWQRQLGEPFVGFDQSGSRVYVPTDLPALQSPTLTPLAAGLRRLISPQSCGNVPAPTTADTCGVPLGERCRFDSDCQGGHCLSETSFPWRGGYCTVLEPPANGCRPGAAAYMPLPRAAQFPSTIKGLYLRHCTQNADCARAGDMGETNIVCDPGLQGCYSSSPLLVPVGRPITLDPFCAM